MKYLRCLSLLLVLLLIFPLCTFAEEVTKTYETPYFTIRLPEQNSTATDKDLISEYVQTFFGGSADFEYVFFSYDPVRKLYWYATAVSVSDDEIVPDLIPSEISQFFDSFYSEFNKTYSIEKWQTGYLEHNSGTMLRFDLAIENNGVSMEQVNFVLPLRKSDQNYNVNLICQAYGVMSKTTLAYIDDILLNYTFFPGSLPKIISEAERAKQAIQTNHAEQAESVPKNWSNIILLLFSNVLYLFFVGVFLYMLYRGAKGLYNRRRCIRSSDADLSLRSRSKFKK